MKPHKIKWSGRAVYASLSDPKIGYAAERFLENSAYTVRLRLANIGQLGSTDYWTYAGSVPGQFVADTQDKAMARARLKAKALAGDRLSMDKLALEAL